MSRKAVKAESIEGCTHLTWEDDTGARESQKYLFTRGAIAWPKGMVPGIALIAGQNPDGKVEVFEEREFKTISEAARILLDWWPRYRSECYYAVIGDCTFVSDLEDLLKKEKADNIEPPSSRKTPIMGTR